MGRMRGGTEGVGGLVEHFLRISRAVGCNRALHRQVHVVGDRQIDLQAGTAVGCQPHLVRTGKGARLDAAQIAQLCEQVPGTVVHADLAAFAEHITRAERRLRGSRGENDSDFDRLA